MYLETDWTKRYDLVPIIPWNPNSWDKETGSPDVVLINGEWYGYYGGKLEERTSGRGRKVGLAFSNDGLLWAEIDKYPGNPIIEFQGTIRDTDYGILGTAIGKNPDGTPALWNGKYVIIFGNYDGIDSTLQWATSIDGKNWTERGETGINKGPPGSGDTGEAYAGSLIRNFDGTWYLFYYGGGPTRTIGVAYGSSPTTLVPYTGNPILIPNSSSWDKKMVDRPNVLWNPDSGEYIMAYSGRDGYATSNGIGMAKSSNLLQWTKIGRIINHGVSGSSDAGMMSVVGFNKFLTGNQVIWRIYYNAFSDIIGPNGYDGYYGGHIAEYIKSIECPILICDFNITVI